MTGCSCADVSCPASTLTSSVDTQVSGAEPESLSDNFAENRSFCWGFSNRVYM
jgi:hypothetical protein